MFLEKTEKKHEILEDDLQIIWHEDGTVTLPKIEFYINHTCNLTCKHCNRFNNHRFTGIQRWQDYEADIREWKKHIRGINQIVIMGGEPLLNPTLVDWIKGLNELWPQSVQILSNGTRLNHAKGLYEVLAEPVAGSGSRNWIGISLHNSDEFQTIIGEAEKFLQGHIQSSTDASVLSDTGAELQMWDENDVRIKFWQQNEFGQSAVIEREDGSYTLHQSDVEVAHRCCGFQQFKCYHMIKGKLHKCGPVGLFPDFDAQLNLDISNEDRKLINSYEPLSPWDWDTRGEEFLQHINDPLPQCKFCPEGWRTVPEMIYPKVKGKEL